MDIVIMATLDVIRSSVTVYDIEMNNIITINPERVAVDGDTIVLCKLSDHYEIAVV